MADTRGSFLIFPLFRFPLVWHWHERQQGSGRLRRYMGPIHSLGRKLLPSGSASEARCLTPRSSLWAHLHSCSSQGAFSIPFWKFDALKRKRKLSGSPDRLLVPMDQRIRSDVKQLRSSVHDPGGIKQWISILLRHSLAIQGNPTISHAQSVAGLSSGEGG